MPKITVHTGDNGRVLPAGPIIDTLPGSKLEFRAYPNPGYRVKLVRIDGESRGRSPCFSFNADSAHRHVEVQFCQTYLNRTSKFTLENRSGGIQVKFRVDRSEDATADSTIKVMLFNSSNSITYQWDTTKGCELGYSTLSAVSPGKDEQAVPVEIPSDTMHMDVVLQVQGGAVSMYLNTPDGKQPGTLFGKLYGGAGAQLSEGWVVTVDGMTSSPAGDYALDISNFAILADGKRPLVDSSAYHRSLHGMVTADSLEA